MFVVLDKNSGISIRKQLYDAITFKILKRELTEGDRLPSTRELANKLGIARNTVIEIYEQLISEGCLETVNGRGTFVAGWKEGKEGIPSNGFAAVSRVKGRLKRTGGNKRIDFATGVPDLKAFPGKAWLRALKEGLDEVNDDQLGYGPVMGYMPLRQSISRYLMKHKGIHCAAEQVVIVNGTSDALVLIAQLFCKTISELLVESAVVSFVPEIFKTFGYKLKPLKTDQNGICTLNLPEAEDGLIFSSPSHQFPLGGMLTMERRLQLADYVKSHRHYIIEDDYDSEFRYAGAPVNSIYQLVPENVIHLGTFSKTLAPFLRLGYMVVPAKLVPAVKELQTILCRRVGMHDQMTLNNLIEQGIYARHIMTMCKRYKRKMRCITQALQNEFGDSIRILGSNSGLHVAVSFSGPLFDAGCTKIFLRHGVSVEQLTEYTLEKRKDCDTLILGFGNLDESVIPEGIKRLKAAVSEIISSNIYSQ